MKERLKRLALRIDAMTLRERVLIFAAMVTLLLLLPYSMAIQPALRRQQSLLDRIRQDQSQINALQEQIRQTVTGQQEAPDPAGRAKLEGLEQHLAQIEQEIADKQKRLIPAEKVSDLLRSIMGNNSRVELVSLNSASGGQVELKPAAAPQAPGTAPAAQAAPAPGAAAPGKSEPPKMEIYKHGVDLTLRGNYLDLLGYVSDLERSPWRLIWGPIRLEVEQYPVVKLTVTVYTLSTERSAFSL